MNKFIFDVDGTLTPSRAIIDEEFKVFFEAFCEINHVYLVTGSDYPKTVEQVGKNICNHVEKIYNCSGNDIWVKGKNIHTNDWKLPEGAHSWLSEQLTKSSFELRTGLHFEHRPGMCNFSVVGRNATLDERKLYVEWDTSQKERDRIASSFCKFFPKLEAKVGGETGIDIYPKGSDKAQIVKDFDATDRLYFFGDAMHPEGNDYSLSKLVHVAKHVSSWYETHRLLKNLQQAGIAQ